MKKLKKSTSKKNIYLAFFLGLIYNINVLLNIDKQYNSGIIKPLNSKGNIYD